jgi:hypothetical protein
MRASSRAIVVRQSFVSLARLAPWALATSIGLSFGLPGCQTYGQDLERSQKAFERADYERALAIFRSLEPDVTRHFSPQEQAQYAYLRGMTDYRVGYKVDARHWLALAHAIDSSQLNVLPKDWRGRLKDTLDELNEQVYTQGIESLAESQEEAAKTGPKTGAKDAPAAKPKSEDEP